MNSDELLFLSETEQNSPSSFWEFVFPSDALSSKWRGDKRGRRTGPFFSVRAWLFFSSSRHVHFLPLHLHLVWSCCFLLHFHLHRIAFLFAGLHKISSVFIIVNTILFIDNDVLVLVFFPFHSVHLLLSPFCRCVCLCALSVGSVCLSVSICSGCGEISARAAEQKKHCANGPSLCALANSKHDR